LLEDRRVLILERIVGLLQSFTDPLGAMRTRALVVLGLQVQFA
jgi:hypothetical protein